ncbi:TIGR00730 family Rossman fold protein [Corynebacterium sp. 13CS0277]|uniref:TIGR00730 family Rossman fold protein n=1 Tax=Corynebacterium sp. 13CS0277 TaxID=2071994 RepID=UPI0011B20FD3|nr:TIGR00730 family Rossman fold protein [Corynebacterium sp. 13CS0277]
MTHVFRPMTTHDTTLREEAITRNLQEHSLPLDEAVARSLTHFVPQRGDAGMVATAADNPENVVGCAWVTFQRGNTMPDLVTFVADGHQNLGIGTGLIEHLVAHAENAGWAGLILPVEDHHPARRVYARLGFESRAEEEDMVRYLHPPLRRVAVYCGSAAGARAEYVDAAEELGAQLAARGIELVYGGGNVGLMGALGSAVVDHGGVAIGVMPTQLVDKEMAHPRLSTLEVVDTMAARKQRMEDLADCFVVLPGGVGTLEELFQAFTGQQLAGHNNPIAFLNVEGFYNPLVACLARMAEEGFIQDKYIDALIVADSVDDLFEQLDTWRAPGPKWGDA